MYEINPGAAEVHSKILLNVFYCGNEKKLEVNVRLQSGFFCCKDNLASNPKTEQTNPGW